MKTQRLFLLVALTVLVVAMASAQITSAGSGTWATPGTWVGGVVPDSTSGTVTILSGHNVNVAANANVGNITVDAGGTLTLTCGAVATSTLTIASFGTLTVNGTFTIAGSIVATAAPYNLVLMSDGVNTGTIVVNGTVNASATSATAGTKGFLPVATWNDGSTLNVNAVGGNTATGWGAGGNQSFYNVNYQVTLHAASANFGWGFTTGAVRNELNILRCSSTSVTARLQLFGGSSGNVTINKLTQTNGMLTGSGTSSGNTIDTVFVTGDVSITGGVFSLDRGSHGAGNDGSGVKWIFTGDNVTIAPNSVINGAANANGMVNSNTQGLVFPFVLDSRFIMAKAGAQNLRIAPAICTSAWGINVEVTNGAQVTLTGTTNIIYLVLTNGNIIAPTASPLVMGWVNAGAPLSGTIGDLAGNTDVADATNNIVGNLGWSRASVSPFTVVYPIAKGGVYLPVTISATPSAATASIFYAEMFNAAPAANTLPGSLTKVSEIRNYVISESAGGSAFTAGAVTLSYDASDFVSDPTNLRVAQNDGAGNWVDLGGVGTGAPAGTILSTTAITSLAGTVFTLANATGGSNPLPVEMTSFTAVMQGTSALLNWATATETNNAGFKIERSVEGSGVWVAVATVQGAGSSSSPKAYSYTDENLAAGAYIYRIQQIDNDGTATIYTANVDAGVSNELKLLGNYPNPFNPSTNMQFSVPQSGYASLKVYNMLGQEVATLFSGNAVAGHYISATFNASRFASGIYFARLQYNGKSLVQRMLLTK